MLLEGNVVDLTESFSWSMVNFAVSAGLNMEKTVELTIIGG